MVREKRGCINSTPERSFIKATTWEIIAFIITLVAVYLVYGDIGKSIKFTLVLTVIKILFLYVHERIWKKTTWGKIYEKSNSRV